MADNNKKHIIVCGKGGGSGTQVQADWNETDSTSPAYINNKPTGLSNEWWGTQAEYDAFTLNQSGNASIDFDEGISASTMGMHQMSNDHTDETINCSVDQTSVLEFKFVYYEPTGWYYIGNCDNYENDFRTFIYGGDIYVDCGDSVYGDGRRIYSADFSNRTGHIISVTMSNTYNKWYDETAGETIIEANDTVYSSSFSLSDLYLRGDVEWTLITAKLTTQNSVEFDLSVDSTGLYDAVADDYISLGANWENVVISSGISWNDISNKPNFATVATSGSYNDLSDKPNLATVATTGSYGDLSGKPTIPVLPLYTTEALTFTLANNTTVTLNVYVQPDPQTLDYFYVEDASGYDNTLTIHQTDPGSSPAFEVLKSTDKLNWTSMGVTGSTDLTATVPANGKLYLKANTYGWSNDIGQRNVMNCSANFNVGGNIMSLLAGDNYSGATLDSNYTKQFYWMMSQSNVVDASDLELPSNTTADCYQGMFWQCSSLTTAPVLPATTLADRCYMSMFVRCTSLTATPTFVATALGEGSYFAMFEGCSSLTTVAALPNGSWNSYDSPYRYMFTTCPLIDSITTYFTGDYTTYLEGWLTDVAQTGDFYNLGGATFAAGADGIPTGWTEHNSI